MRKLFVNSSLAGFWIAADEDLGAAGVFVQWPDAVDGWAKRTRYIANRVRLREVDSVLAYGTGWPGAPGCGRPKRSSEASAPFTLRVTPTERARWSKLAGERSLGEWIRERCNAAAALIEWSRPNGWTGRPTPAASPRGEHKKGEGAEVEVETRTPPAQLELLGADAPS